MDNTTTKTPVYQLGSPDPQFFVHGGVDAKLLYLNKLDSDDKLPQKNFTLAQTFSFSRNVQSGKVSGEITSINIDGQPFKCLLENNNPIQYLELLVANDSKKGIAFSYLFYKPEFQVEKYEISVDDIVTVSSLTFTCDFFEVING